MTTTKPDADRPYRGRRLTWAEFRQLTGREPANDNHKENADDKTDSRRAV